MNRISRDEMNIQLAEVISKRATCTRNAVGVVVVRDGRVIGVGYNSSPPGDPHCIDDGCEIGPDGGCSRTIHAEVNSIYFLARAGISTEGTILYTTLSPCMTCARAIVQAGIKEVIYKEAYRDTSPVDFLRRHGVRTRQHKRDLISIVEVMFPNET